jgi:hypothetical protein
MTTAEGNISNLQGRMTAAEGGVAAAVADIEALQQATLDQQQDIIDLAGEDTAQKRRIAALELWKDGTNNNGAAADIDALKADSNTQASDIAELKLWRDGLNGNDGAAADIVTAKTNISALELWRSGTGSNGAEADINALKLWRDGTSNDGAAADISTLKAASLAQQKSIADLTEADSAQVKRIAALELWKNGPNNNDGAAADIAKLREDVNAATAAAAANAALISGLRTDVTNIGNDVTALIEEMAQLKESISVDDSGNAIFGKTGQRTDIRGNVYINGLPYVPGGTS